VILPSWDYPFKGQYYWEYLDTDVERDGNDGVEYDGVGEENQEGKDRRSQGRVLHNFNVEYCNVPYRVAEPDPGT